MATTFKPWTPYVPPPPPAGSYDPALDAQGYAAQRGLLDLEQDIRTANTRGTVDYGLSRDDITRQRDRGFFDLDTARSRGDEDYRRNIEMLQRSYQQLGNRQSQQMRTQGVARGGAALQAASKRQANQAIDRQPIDTNYQRFSADNRLARTRLGEDSDLAFGRLALMSAPPDASNPFGGREFQDRTTQLTRAQREGSAFGLDLNAQRYYQAAGAGWMPPGRGETGGQAGNEYRDAQGNPYRVVIQGNQAVGVDPSGRELWRRRRA